MTDEMPARGPNPLFQPASRIEVYVLIILAMGSKVLPWIVPGATSATGLLLDLLAKAP